MPNYPGYPQVVGHKREVIHDHKGPASYTQFAGGGDPFVATQATMGWIEDVVGMAVDNTGTYAVFGVKNPGPQASVILVWYTLIGMTEVAGAVNLSASTVPLYLRGF